MATQTDKAGRGKKSELPGLTSLSTGKGSAGKGSAGKGAAGKGKPPRQGKAGGRKGRRPLAPVKVGRDRNWGPIAMFVAVGVLAVGIIGFAFYTQRTTTIASWEQRAADIEDIAVFDQAQLNPEHVDGPLAYDTLPPVGGPHNGIWQNCEGMVYPAPLANEHAVHSLEHGAVWITYHTELPAAEIDELARFVDGNDYTFMSPFPGLDAPISLQAWGYQLKVDTSDDPRIAEFIRSLRNNTGPEAGRATCGGPDSTTHTGTTPISGQGMG